MEKKLSKPQHIMHVVKHLKKHKMIDDKNLIYFICECAERALSRVQNPHPDCVEAVRIAKLFADGKCTENDLAIAAWDASTQANMLFVSGVKLDTKSYAALSTSYMHLIINDIETAVWATSSFAFDAADTDIGDITMEYTDQLNFLEQYYTSTNIDDKPTMPKTNKNNEICYFCGKPTESMFGFGARYCPTCKK